MTFQEIIKQGIPSELPAPQPYPAGVSRAPKRKDILSVEEKQIFSVSVTRLPPGGSDQV